MDLQQETGSGERGTIRLWEGFDKRSGDVLRAGSVVTSIEMGGNAFEAWIVVDPSPNVDHRSLDEIRGASL